MAIMVNYVPRYNFVLDNKLQCFQGFLRRKIKAPRVLVLNLVEISVEFLAFIDFKITETLGLLPFRALL